MKAKRTAKTDILGTDAVAGGEDVGVISPRSLIEAATSAINPLTMARESARLYGEWLSIMLGRSERDVPVKDWRFADPTVWGKKIKDAGIEPE